MEHTEALSIIEETFPGETQEKYEERITELQGLADAQADESVTLEALLRTGLSMMTMCAVTQDRRLSKERFNKIFWRPKGTDEAKK